MDSFFTPMFFSSLKVIFASYLFYMLLQCIVWHLIIRRFTFSQLHSSNVKNFFLNKDFSGLTYMLQSSTDGPYICNKLMVHETCSTCPAELVGACSAWLICTCLGGLWFAVLGDHQLGSSFCSGCIARSPGTISRILKFSPSKISRWKKEDKSMATPS